MQLYPQTLSVFLYAFGSAPHAAALRVLLKRWRKWVGREMTGSWGEAERDLELLKMKMKDRESGKKKVTGLRNRERMRANRGGEDKHVEDRKKSSTTESRGNMRTRDLDNQQFFSHCCCGVLRNSAAIRRLAVCVFVCPALLYQDKTCWDLFTMSPALLNGVCVCVCYLLFKCFLRS